MQHHGAPTRLLDCTFSPFVAAAFAMEKGRGKPELLAPERKTPVIWCFNSHWCEEQAKKNTDHRALIVRRNNDKHRNDKTFIPLFQLVEPSSVAPSPRRKFVKSENPIHLNERLSAQQGTFLCPADLTSRFVDNLKAMDGWKEEKNVQKLCLELDQKKAEKFARNLKIINVSFAALFPGLDGFAKSIAQEIGHYYDLARGRSGLGGRG